GVYTTAGPGGERPGGTSDEHHGEGAVEQRAAEELDLLLRVRADRLVRARDRLGRPLGLRPRRDADERPPSLGALGGDREGERDRLTPRTEPAPGAVVLRRRR